MMVDKKTAIVYKKTKLFKCTASIIDEHVYVLRFTKLKRKPVSFSRVDIVAEA